jgi:hypothetical protein
LHIVVLEDCGLVWNHVGFEVLTAVVMKSSIFLYGITCHGFLDALTDFILYRTLIEIEFFFTAVTLKCAMFGDVMLCDQVEVDRHFRGTLCLPCCFLGMLFNPEDGGSMFLKNVSKLLPHYLASHPGR